MKQPSSKQTSGKKNPATSTTAARPDLAQSKKLQWEPWVIILTAIVYYANTLGNGHALDDVMVITMNAFTKKGFTGIHGLLTKDSMFGFIGSDNPLPGGRYRPLSLITFALEYQFFGDNPAIGHFINLVLYAFTGWLLWYFLKKFIFKTTPAVAFITAMLFIIHPIHTEVVANIKSRDEILALLASLGSFYFLFKFTEGKKESKYLVFSVLCFFIGLFAKENTIMYLAVMPLGLWCFSKTDFRKSFKYLTPHLISALIFIAIRASVIASHRHLVNNEIMNDPFLHATFSQKYSTIFLTLLYYLKLIFFPYPLSYDYSYNQIPLTSFSDWRVLVSILIYLLIFAWAVYKIRSKNIYAFGILYFLSTFFITSNLVFNIGAPMAERFLYMPSIGLCIILAVLLYRGYEKIQKVSGQNFARAGALLIAILFIIPTGYETMARNAQWDNDISLYTHDVHVVPHSAAALQRCGTSYIFIGDSVRNGHADSITDRTKANHYYDVAIGYYENALKIYPQYVDAFLNLGLANLKEFKFEAAENNWDSATKYNPSHPKLKEYYKDLGRLYMNRVAVYHNKGNFPETLKFLQKAEHVIPDDPEVYYNFGGYYFTLKDYTKAREYWQKCLELNPAHEHAQAGMNAIRGK